jgi:lysophospholipase L1-like esterase
MPLRIVCFGDSIIGYRPRTSYLHQYAKFSDHLQLMLEGKYGRGPEVLNRGWAGDTSYGDGKGDRPGATARLQKDVLDERPDIAILLFGANDANLAYSSTADTSKVEEARERFRAALLQMVGTLKEKFIRTLLLQYHTPRSTNMSQVWGHANAFNAVIGEIALAQGTPTLELEPHFAEAAKTCPLNELTSQTDGLHLNPGGEIVYARAIFEKLVELRWARTVK